MKIVFENKDFSRSLSIGFKGKHQMPLITIIEEHFDTTTDWREPIFLGADMLWNSSYLWRKPLLWFKRKCGDTARRIKAELNRMVK